MKPKTKFTISIDEDILKEGRRILDDLGVKPSFYLETIMRALVDSETKPMKEVYGEVYGPLFEKINKHAMAKKRKRKT